MAASPPPVVDPGPPRRRIRTAATLFWGAVALALVIGLTGGHDEPSEVRPATNAAPAAPSVSSAVPEPSAPQRETKHLPRSRPVRLIIPKISVDAPFTSLAIGPTGQLEPPPAHDTNLVGWYADGASPGERGTAIIAGHVDTATSAAVFVGLGELKKGDRFRVERADGTTATFEVYDAEQFAKDDFPSERVYADTPDAQVRLITCAGPYDHQARDYTENLVVFARLV